MTGEPTTPHDEEGQQVGEPDDGLPRLRAGDVLAGRYLVADLLGESRGGRFWRAEDQVLARHVALHVIAADDERADGLLEAARLSATVHDRRILRVLDADRVDGLCFVVNEWGAGSSLDIMLARDGPLSPRRAAHLVAEAAAVTAAAHDADVAHGRLAPENLLVDHHGSVRIIGLAVEAALWGLPPGRTSSDVTDLAALLYAGLTGRWCGVSRSAVPPAHQVGGRVLRPRKVRAGVPRVAGRPVRRGPQRRGDRHAREDAVRPRHCPRHRRRAAPTSSVTRRAWRSPSPSGRWRSRSSCRTEPAGRRPPPAREPHPSPCPSRSPSRPGDRDRTPSPSPSRRARAEAPSPRHDEPEPAPPLLTETTPPVAALESTDQPTQAGMPIFDDERDEVAWISARAEKPPPPPPFEEKPAKPLFAPDPPSGRPVRTPRPG